MSDSTQKTPTQILVEVLECEEIDRIKRLVVLYEDADGFVVKAGHRDRFEVIGMLLYGANVVSSIDPKRESGERENG